MKKKFRKILYSAFKKAFEYSQKLKKEKNIKKYNLHTPIGILFILFGFFASLIPILPGFAFVFFGAFVLAEKKVLSLFRRYGFHLKKGNKKRSFSKFKRKFFRK